MKTQSRILEDLVLIHLDITQWSGRRGLKSEDLVIQGELPASVVSLGSKKIIDPERIRVFGSIKRRMERACLSVGTRFLGGYAIPKGHFDEVAATLDKEVRHAEQEKQDLLSKYDAIVEDWIRKHPSFAESIRRAVVPSTVVDARIHFDWVAIHVSAVEGEHNAQRMEQRAQGLGSQLFKEVGVAARGSYEKTYKGKAECTQKAVTTVSGIRKKLESLSFIDHRVQPVIDEIDAVLGDLPKTGKLSGTHFIALRGLIELLADENRLKQHGESALNIESESESLLSSDDEQQAGDDLVLNDLPNPEPEPEPEPKPEPEKAPAEPVSDWFW